jgi:ribosomal protein S18 acetylase RimI-like enzyme
MTTAGVTIREARPSDAKALLRYVQDLFEEPDIDIPLSPGEFILTRYEEERVLEQYAESDNSVFLLALETSRIVGALTCEGSTHEALRHGVTLGISVRRDRRGRGIGDALMTKALEWAVETGVVRRIELHVYARNETAIRLYRKHGFEIEGRRRRIVYRDGEFLDDLIMARLL